MTKHKLIFITVVFLSTVVLSAVIRFPNRRVTGPSAIWHHAGLIQIRRMIQTPKRHCEDGMELDGRGMCRDRYRRGYNNLKGTTSVILTRLSNIGY